MVYSVGLVQEEGSPEGSPEGSKMIFSVVFQHFLSCLIFYVLKLESMPNCLLKFSIKHCLLKISVRRYTHTQLYKHDLNEIVLIKSPHYD